MGRSLHLSLRKSGDGGVHQHEKFVHEQAPTPKTGERVCALLDVSPRDRRLCVLPGWQMNVNVNVNVKTGERGADEN